MKPTTLVYLEDQDIYELEAEIVNVFELDKGTSIILDQTIFYPQGGGQPYDQGLIVGDGLEFKVEEVRFIDGLAHHIGKALTGAPAIGQKITCKIDVERRLLNSREHSAGHLLSFVIESMGYDLSPDKGHHFPGQCYVSYHGEISEDKREEFRAAVEKRMNQAITDSIPVELKIVEYDQLKELCDMIPLYVPKDKPSRIMRIMFPERPITMPCGGTHVNNLSEIGRVRIKKCSVKKGVTKMSYECI